MAGPLAGIRVIEFEGIGPAPYCGMLLADLGADVTRIRRPSADRGALIADTADQVMDRGKSAITLDLKTGQGKSRALDLLGEADALVEGLRPGTMERLGLGPEDVQRRNQRLVYLRITGWGQEGPLAQTAGHDINYIALSGALALMGPANGPPLPPANLIGDFGGGGLYAAFGLLAGVIEAARTGQGRVIDAAMLDGAASQMAFLYAWAATGTWRPEREANLLDGGAPFYRCYACADGKYVAVGAIEPAFFAALLTGLGIDAADISQNNRQDWPEITRRIAAVFASETRDHWTARFAATDSCVTPVLDMWEAAHHPHNRIRKTFVDNPVQPAPGPRFS